MARSKIVNDNEVRRWFEQGKPYSWMQQEYRRKYNIDTTISMWGNYRRRHGLELRMERDSDLIPWRVEREHRWSYPLQMLRLEGRRRRGDELRPVDQVRLDAWRKRVDEEQLVVHYEPETDEGFFLIPREPGDDDIIRRPAQEDGTVWGE